MKFKPPKGITEPLSIGLTSGHSLLIEPKGTTVPTHFRRAAIAAGCIPVGMDADEAELTLDAGDVRQQRIIEGIEKMLDGDDESDFSQDGKPDARKLSKVVGFMVSREERDAAWEKFEAELKKSSGKPAGDGGSEEPDA